jgi:hypothetical protein
MQQDGAQCTSQIGGQDRFENGTGFEYVSDHGLGFIQSRI